MAENSFITLLLVIANISASVYAWNNEDVMRKWVMNPYRVYTQKQYYRFFTAAFIHADWMHLIFNAISLYSFGRVVEIYFQYFSPEYGLFLYVFMYVFSIPASKIVTYIKYRNHPGYNSLGASGAVSAVIFSSILLNPFSGIYFLLIPFEIPGFIFGAIYMIYSHVSSLRNTDNVNHDAHFYGAAFGIVFTALVFPHSLPSFIAELSQWSFF